MPPHTARQDRATAGCDAVVISSARASRRRFR